VIAVAYALTRGSGNIANTDFFDSLSSACIAGAFFARSLKWSDIFFSLFLISRAFPAKMRKLFTHFDGFARFYKKILLQK